MTVVNPNSISGITSITLPSGGDNVLTIHTNDGIERFRIDSSGNVKVGSAATISPDGDLFVTGVTTTGGHFAGSGANLTSLPAANLTGTLPAISAANLTNVPAANITGTLPAISAANLTNIPAANVTGTLPALTAANLTNIPASNIVGLATAGFERSGGFGGGKVLQVLQATKTDKFSSSSTSFVDITGLSVNITPSSSSSKILVLAQCTVVGSDAGTGIMLDRDGSEPLKADSEGNRQRFTITGAYGDSAMYYSNGANHISYLDSPNTTSQITYKLKAKTRSSSTFWVNTTAHRNNDTNTSNSTSTLTVMEISS